MRSPQVWVPQTPWAVPPSCQHQRAHLLKWGAIPSDMGMLIPDACVRSPCMFLCGSGLCVCSV